MASRAALELLIELNDRASKGLGSIGGSLRTIGETAIGMFAGGLITKGFDALTSTLGDAFEGARQAGLVMAQTQQTINSMGNAAGVSAQHVADFAASLSDASGKSLFGDDQIQAATNMLLTFGNIKGATLDLATALTVDMAQALKKTPADLSVMIGKLLNSSDAMSAAKKMGVSFTDEQIKLGKHLFETGHIAEYQALVMGELNKEFGGQAAAAANAAGGMVQFKARIGEAAETLVGGLLPVMDRLGTFLNDTIAPAVERAATAFNAWLSNPATIATIDAITNAISTGLSAAFTYLSGTILPAVSAIIQGQILPVLGTLVSWFQTVLPQAIAFVNENWESFRGALIAIGAVLAGAAIVGTLASLAATIATLASPIGLLVAAVALLGAAWSGNWGGIRDILTTFWEGTAKPILTDLYTWLATTIPPAIQTLAAFWTGTLQPALAAVWAFIQTNVIPILNTLVTVYIAVLKAEIQVLSALWTNVLLPALNTIWSFISTYVIPIISALVNVNIAILKKEIEALSALWKNVLLPALTDVWNFIQTNVIPAVVDTSTKANDLATKIRETLGPAFTWLGDNVLKPVTGFFNDIGGAVQDVIDWINDLASTINNIQIPDWLQGHSPPPMADWFGYIADEAQRASQMADMFTGAIQRAGAGAGSLGGAGGASSGGIGDLGGVFTPAFGRGLRGMQAAAAATAGGFGGTTSGGLAATAAPPTARAPQSIWEAIAGTPQQPVLTIAPGGIVIHAAPGQNERQIAEMVVREIDRRLRSKK
jgi:hypothetical protein